tara:strand:- start:1836 stop:2000 length:165 start_codon:yes stop_codon:yes gene_type:complete
MFIFKEMKIDEPTATGGIIEACQKSESTLCANEVCDIIKNRLLQPGIALVELDF